MTWGVSWSLYTHFTQSALQGAVLGQPWSDGLGNPGLWPKGCRFEYNTSILGLKFKIKTTVDSIWYSFLSKTSECIRPRMSAMFGHEGTESIACEREISLDLGPWILSHKKEILLWLAFLSLKALLWTQHIFRACYIHWPISHRVHTTQLSQQLNVKY